MFSPAAGWFLAAQFGGFAVIALLVFAGILRARTRFRRRHPDFKSVGLIDITKGLINEANRIFLTGDPAPAILWLTTLLFFIGLFLIHPLETFGSTKTYAYLDRTFATESVWGFGLTALAVCKLALLGYCSIDRTPFSPTAFYTSVIVNLLMALIYFNIALGSLFSNSASFGWIVYFALTGGSLWCSARRLRQAQGGR